MNILYTAASANGQRASVALEECGIDYTARLVDLAAGEHHSEELLQLLPAKPNFRSQNCVCQVRNRLKNITSSPLQLACFLTFPRYYAPCPPKTAPLSVEKEGGNNCYKLHPRSGLLLPR